MWRRRRLHLHFIFQWNHKISKVDHVMRQTECRYSSLAIERYELRISKLQYRKKKYPHIEQSVQKREQNISIAIGQSESFYTSSSSCFMSFCCLCVSAMCVRVSCVTDIWIRSNVERLMGSLCIYCAKQYLAAAIEASISVLLFNSIRSDVLQTLLSLTLCVWSISLHLPTSSLCVGS